MSVNSASPAKCWSYGWQIVYQPTRWWNSPTNNYLHWNRQEETVSKKPLGKKDVTHANQTRQVKKINRHFLSVGTQKSLYNPKPHLYAEYPWANRTYDFTDTSQCEPGWEGGSTGTTATNTAPLLSPDPPSFQLQLYPLQSPPHLPPNPCAGLTSLLGVLWPLVHGSGCSLLEADARLCWLTCCIFWQP